ncbi:MAG: gamma-glutamyltransferase [Alphaproteobacteria bacterium]
MPGRQCAVVMALVLGLSGCADDGPPVGVVGHVSNYFGGVAADEPQATLIGRDVLSAGGTAADAAVAMAFAMMVTRPDVAGLGGGGVCMYFDKTANKAEALDFLPRAARTRPPSGRWIASVPGSPRGLFALHARYGQLRWEQTVLPAERMARFGTPMPRGLIRAIAASPGRVAASPGLKALLSDRNGKILAEGEALRQADLSGTLSNMRAVGPGPFHTAVQARQFIDSVRGAGGWLTIEDMRAYRPVWRKTITMPFGNHMLHFAPSPAVGGRVVAALWTALGESGGFADATPADRPRLIASAANKAYGATLSRPNADRASAGLLVIDREGNAAACVLTMNRFFGSGRLLTGNGVVAVSPADGGATLGVAPALMVNHNVPQAFMAATGAGDGSAPIALATVMLGAVSAGQNMDEAMAAVRPRPSGGEGRAAALVNIMLCPEGMLGKPDLCAVRSDPRGFGYAINAER